MKYIYQISYDLQRADQDTKATTIINIQLLHIEEKKITFITNIWTNENLACASEEEGKTCNAKSKTLLRICHTYFLIKLGKTRTKLYLIPFQRTLHPPRTRNIHFQFCFVYFMLQNAWTYSLPTLDKSHLPFKSEVCIYCIISIFRV